MRKLLAIATVLVIVASACSSTSDQTGAPVELTDAETTWCDDFNNFPAIAESAIAAQVDGYEILDAEKVRILDNLGGSFLDTFLGAFMELEWRPTHAVGYADACKAAYASR